MANLGTGNDNINIDGATAEFVDFGGTDTYTILNSLSGDVIITDNQASTFNLPGGLTITNAAFLADGVQFTINGFTLTLIGNPSLFTFVFGGTPLDPTDGTPQTFEETAAAFGTTVPAAGEPANNATTTGEINGDGTVGVTTPAETFALTAGAASVDEGETATFTLTTENVAEGTEVAYTISGVDAADVTGALTGTATVGADGTATITVDVAADELTEGEETLTVALDNGEATADVIVNDTSLTPVFAITADAANADEGTTATFTLTTENVAEGTEVAYTLSGVDAADVTGALTGTATVGADGTATISVDVAADELTEGEETLTVALDNGEATADVIVNDTSLTPVFEITASAESVDESGTATFEVTNGEPNTVYAYQVEGTGAVDDVATFTTDADGNATITVEASDDVAAGGASITVTVIGESATASVDVNPVNDAPVLTDPAATLADGTEDTAYTVSEADLLQGYTDEEGDTLSVANLTADSGATVADNGDGTYTITPAADFNGAVTLSYDVTDGTAPTAATQTVNFAAVNDAPTTTDATNTATEAGAAVTGQLDAADVDGDDLTFTLDAPVEGLTLNADGTYSFDPAANTAVQALTYTSGTLDVVANYTVSDGNGGTAQGSLTVSVEPTPLTFTLESSVATVEEGSTVEYTVVASEAVQSDFTGNVQISLEDGDTASLADFGSGSFNPQPITIATGQTVSNAVTITPANDAATETPETFTANATIAGFDIASVQTTVQDPSSVGGLGQTFTLTTGVDTIPGLVGSAGSTGTDGNDTIIGTINVAAAASGGNTSTISALDNINGGLGTDTLKVQVVATTAVGDTQTQLNALTLSNVEIVDLASAVALTANTSAFAGVTDVNVSNITSGATSVTAGATQDVTLNDAAVDAAVAIVGGKDVDVTLTNTTGAANTISVGGGAGAAGTIDVSSTADAISGPAATAMGAIATTGGTTVNITQDANSVSGNAATTAVNPTTVVTTGAVNVTGGSTTTTVNVSNGDQVAAVSAVAGVTGVQQTQTVTFTALNAGNTVTVNGLTFTATKNLTAAEVAQAFAGLTNVPVTGDRQDDGGPTANGFYTGTHTAATFTTGAAVGNTVTYTEVTAGTNAALAPAAAIGTGTTAPAAPTAAVTTTGVAATAAVTGVAGVANGAVTINDGGTASITDIMVDGYSANAALGGGGSLDALQNLSLMNSGAGTATLTSTATTLNVTLNDVDADVTLPATLTNLTLNTQGTASTGGIIAAGATSVIINAAANLTAGATTNFAGATSVDVNGAGRVNLANNGFANTTALQTFNAADNTGGTTVTLGTGNRVEITGGTGNDVVNLAQTTIAAGDNILLGAGNDTLNFTGAITAGGIAAGVTLSGGEGMMDVLGLTSADAQVVSGSAAFEGFIDGFEILSLGAAGAANTVNLANLDDISHVRYANGGFTQTITNMANNGILEMQGPNPNVGALVQMTDSTGSADVLNIILDDSLAPAGGNVGTVTTSASATAIGAGNTSGVETVNISVDDTFVDLNNDGIDDTNAAFTMNFAEQTATATKLDIGGAGDLLLSTAGFVAAAPLVTVDGSDMTGVLTYTAVNANMTVTGGSGNDMLTVNATADGGTFNGGAGNDTLTVLGLADLVKLNGGTGMDTFDFNGVSTTDSNYAVIQSVDTGDLIDLAGLGVNAFNSTQVTLSLGATESTQAFQEAAMNTLATSAAGWFQTGGNTFIVADLDGNATYDAGVDFTVLLTGVVDLSTASFNATSGTIEIA